MILFPSLLIFTVIKMVIFVQKEGIKPTPAKFAFIVIFIDLVLCIFFFVDPVNYLGVFVSQFFSVFLAFQNLFLLKQKKADLPVPVFFCVLNLSHKQFLVLFHVWLSR